MDYTRTAHADLEDPFPETTALYERAMGGGSLADLTAADQQAFAALAKLGQKEPKLHGLAAGYEQYGSLTLKQAALAFWRLRANHIPFSKSWFAIKIHEQAARDMREFQLADVRDALTDEQREQIKAWREE